MASVGLRNRQNYDEDVITLCEIIGCYVVEIFYNRLYIQAVDRNQNEKNSKSITDEYRKVVSSFLYGIKKNTDSYKSYLTHMYVQFQSWTRFKTIPISEFTDKLLSYFVPSDLFGLLSIKEKNILLNDIIFTITENYAAYCIENIVSVIDHRNKSIVIRQFQDAFNEIMLSKRDSTLAKFIRKDPNSLIDHSAQVNAQNYILINKLKKKIKKIMKEKCEIESKYNKIRYAYGMLEKTYTKLLNDKSKPLIQPQITQPAVIETRSKKHKHKKKESKSSESEGIKSDHESDYESKSSDQESEQNESESSSESEEKIQPPIPSIAFDPPKDFLINKMTKKGPSTKSKPRHKKQKEQVQLQPQIQSQQQSQQQPLEQNQIPEQQVIPPPEPEKEHIDYGELLLETAE